LSPDSPDARAAAPDGTAVGIPERDLVVTADDLGLTAGVTRAVRRAHLDGVVRATSLLAVGRAFEDAVSMLHATPGLDVGVHLALVGEDPPLLSAREVPTLVDDRGRLPLTYRAYLRRAARGRVDPADVHRELSAQVERVVATGLPVTHLDTHQHVHLWPPVAAVVVELAQSQGIRHVRLSRSHARTPLAWGVNALSRLLERRLRDAGLPTLGYAGLDEAGSMSADALVRALAAVAGGVWPAAEVNVHPGLVDADSARFAWGYHWETELATLLDPALPGRVAAAGFRLTGFSGLGSG
jgi:predicted glycoside hydrolase/deacetylase ChbG (UPF0249 family)